MTRDKQATGRRKIFWIVGDNASAIILRTERLDLIREKECTGLFDTRLINLEVFGGEWFGMKCHETVDSVD
jgi:hypothetical protein